MFKEIILNFTMKFNANLEAIGVNVDGSINFLLKPFEAATDRGAKEHTKLHIKSL